MDKHGHIDFQKLSVLTAEDLEHIANCDFCADAWADYMEDYELQTAPKNMQEMILMSSKQLPVPLIAKNNRISKRLQLFCYNLKVGVAAALALGFLFYSHNLPPISKANFVTEEIPFNPAVRLYEKTQNFSCIIQDFSKNIVQMEVTPNDK